MRSNRICVLEGFSSLDYKTRLAVAVRDFAFKRDAYARRHDWLVLFEGPREYHDLDRVREISELEESHFLAVLSHIDARAFDESRDDRFHALEMLFGVFDALFYVRKFRLVLVERMPRDVQAEELFFPCQKRLERYGIPAVQRKRNARRAHRAEERALVFRRTQVLAVKGEERLDIFHELAAGELHVVKGAALDERFERLLVEIFIGDAGEKIGDVREGAARFAGGNNRIGDPRAEILNTV